MSGMGLPYGLQSMLKEGHKHFAGVDEAVLRNIEACKNMAQITRTSLGPNGECVCMLWVRAPHRMHLNLRGAHSSMLFDHHHHCEKCGGVLRVTCSMGN